MRMGTSASYLHAFVIFFYAALLVNILYPTFLLRSRHVAFQRDASFVADTVLDVVYAVVPFLLLALGIRSQPRNSSTRHPQPLRRGISSQRD